MAYLGQVKYNLTDTTEKVEVPNDSRARLMYYLNCMCTVLQLDDDPGINRLCQFRNYFISRAERDFLIQLCILLKPDILLNKCIFQNDQLCGDMGNKFYNLEQVRDSLLFAGNIMIGGRNRRVAKIMTFKMSWLNKYWTQPMQALLEAQRQEKFEMERQARLERQRQLEQERQARLERQRLLQQQRQESLEWERERRTDRSSSTCVIL